MTDIVAGDDQRKPHKVEPEVPVSVEELARLGVLYWRLDASLGEADPLLAKVRAERGYTYVDYVHLSPDKLPNYSEKIKSFFRE
jgi:1,2-dihydroxy-3-keto-5-methylthiopentene dioxygenase